MKEFKLLDLSSCNASQTMETSVQNVFSYYKKANFLYRCQYLQINEHY